VLSHINSIAYFRT